MSKRYALPSFLAATAVSPEQYVRWLRHKADTHVKRDRKRKDHPIMGADYRRLIHAAVERSQGHDFYTGEPLEWEKIGTYSNEESRANRSIYKAGLALLPTVDHVLLEDGTYDFVICAWRTNDAKNDLCHADFVALCRRVLDHHDRAKDLPD